MDSLYGLNEFTPHGFCLAWEPALLSATIIANIGIGLAYWVIPIQLLYFRNTLLANLTKSPVSLWVPVAFGAFIFLCGLTHFMKVVTLFYPFYWIETATDLTTMLVSVGTAIFFGKAISHAVKALKAYRP